MTLDGSTPYLRDAALSFRDVYQWLEAAYKISGAPQCHLLRPSTAVAFPHIPTPALLSPVYTHAIFKVARYLTMGPAPAEFEEKYRTSHEPSSYHTAENRLPRWAEPREPPRIKWLDGHRIRVMLLSLFLLVGLSTFARDHHSDRVADEAWINSEYEIALDLFQKNIHPPGTSPGTVVASDSKHSPNYWYHWVRDAAIVMDKTLVTLYESPETSTADKDKYENLLKEYVGHEYVIQHTQNPSGNYGYNGQGGGLGEPKFNVDDTAFTDNWGRPQNDGPALRAMTLVRFARAYLSRYSYSTAAISYITELYDSKYPTESVIKADLEYIGHRFDQWYNFDLWEEVTNSLHYFTLQVQRCALIEGALLADVLGDSGAADWYNAISSNITTTLDRFWDPNRGIIRSHEQEIRKSNLDISTLLGILHGSGKVHYQLSQPDSDRIFSTLNKLNASFAHEYALNSGRRYPAIGRYPEDLYYNGNPWFLATLAYAELLYRSLLYWGSTGSVTVTSVSIDFFQAYKPISAEIICGVWKDAESRLGIVQEFATDGIMAEQFDRNTGEQLSATNLTWNYGEYLRTYWARKDASAFADQCN
ncbi:Glucoamylase [Neolecta irregularis DAH-3]|uniref:glucan 1,4-alpha-glucosidase n=1 Tax=Neolecta irregularis (strain DAH-3) TaxID=1198029 RepID=A0A1U7LS35_NEOID|nr:Glucoamylase [Neolecta irregularis DAH-3]|eukprot:OLL25439.1 Glucoamylase [Neolecta irregularis DAH-3]